MLLSFRQGLVQHEASGFLTVTPSAVSLVVIDTPVIAALASGTKDYLHVERETVTNAWGPITMDGVDTRQPSLHHEHHSLTGKYNITRIIL